MTPDEINTLRSIGLDLIRSYVATTNETILLTIYGALVLKATSVLLRKEMRISSLITLLAILLMFAICLVLWALDLADFIAEVKLSFISNPELPIKGRLANARSFIFPNIAAIDALYSYLSLMGDGIIIWRVWNLKSYYRPWVILIPIALLFGSLIATLMLTYCVGRLGDSIVFGTFEKPAFCRNVQTATYAMALATTATATILIGFTTWNFRNAIKPLLSGHPVIVGEPRRRRRSPVENILLLLIESGILYFLFFAIQVVGVIPRVHNWVSTKPGVSFAFTMFSYVSSIIVGIYPTAVVVLAHLQTSVLDDAANSEVTSTLRIGEQHTSATSDTWPTIQHATKPENEIELNTGLHSSEHERSQSVKPRESLNA
ncbi:hypothetical protein R3P38DRAFT_173962 [Favolaschia claudopus]|uniref:Uncharacterized protein n=1 Tax=Favolaschia claudopus TaxID=2862362 RepID=A0AAW0CX89_9AGAR